MSQPIARTLAAEVLAYYYASRHSIGRNSLDLAADSAARICAALLASGGSLAPVYADAFALLSQRGERLAGLRAKRLDRIFARVAAERVAQAAAMKEPL